MRLPWNRHESNVPAAKKAIVEGEAHIREVKSRAPEVKKVAKASKRMREDNHFAENLRAIMEGRDRE